MKRLKRLFFTLTAIFACLSTAWAVRTGEAGNYRVELSTQPSVVTLGRAIVKLRITDASGKPAAGLRVKVIVAMPGMPMGEHEEEATLQPDGLYSVPARFAMEGAYEARVTIDGAGTAVIPLHMGEDTSEPASVEYRWIVLGAALVLAVGGFVVYRMRRTGQRIPREKLFTPSVLFSILLIALVLGGVLYGVWHFRRKGAMTPIEAQSMQMEMPAPPGVLTVDMARVERGTLKEEVRYTGQAIGFVEVDVLPRITGYITWMPFYVGDQVRRGQLLIRLDTSQTAPQVAEKEAGRQMAGEQEQVALAESQQAAAMHAEAEGEVNAKTAEIAQVRATVDQARARLVTAEAEQRYWKAELERARTLQNQDALSKEELDRTTSQARTADAKVVEARADIGAALAQLDKAKSELHSHHAHVEASRAAEVASRRKVAAAQAGVMQAEAGVSGALTQRGYTEIHAETDGVITERLVSPGGVVNPGQVILKIARIHPIRLQANVAESDFARIHRGAAVTVRRRDGRGGPVHARVTSMSPSVDLQARTGRVEALVPNKDGRFLPGQYLVMDITVGKAADALIVPASAIVQRAKGAEAVEGTRMASFVWLARPVSGAQDRYSAHEVSVTVGVGDGQRVAVQGDLQPGDRVVARGYESLREGDRVAPTSQTLSFASPTPETAVSPSASPSASPSSGSSASPSASPSSGSSSSPSAGTSPQAVQTASITITDSGYQPDAITLKSGVPARVTFLRQSEHTCGTDVVFPHEGIRRSLPLNEAVVIEFVPHKPGKFRFQCGENMLYGTLVVR